jgi:SAM-dependent methyltransferase
MGSGDWFEYYESQVDREPRELLLRALAAFELEGRVGTAIDVGCGNGADTAELLARGWEVFAFDAEPEAIRRVRERILAEDVARLRLERAAMEEVELPDADLVFASFSIPFCRPQAFSGVWGRLRGALRPGGRFAGQLFGDRDTWASERPEMTFHDEASARARFDGLELEVFEEEEEDGEACSGTKHWHVFHVIARRPEDT